MYCLKTSGICLFSALSIAGYMSKNRSTIVSQQFISVIDRVLSSIRVWHEFPQKHNSMKLNGWVATDLNRFFGKIWAMLNFQYWSLSLQERPPQCEQIPTSPLRLSSNHLFKSAPPETKAFPASTFSSCLAFRSSVFGDTLLRRYIFFSFGLFLSSRMRRSSSIPIIFSFLQNGF